jgi:hypothetical protein
MLGYINCYAMFPCSGALVGLEGSVPLHLYALVLLGLSSRACVQSNTQALGRSIERKLSMCVREKECGFGVMGRHVCLRVCNRTHKHVCLRVSNRTHKHEDATLEGN